MNHQINGSDMQGLQAKSSKPAQSVQPNVKNIHLQRSVCDQAAEQPFELDYLLADYLPDIFKILKCDVMPTITNLTVTDGRLTADLSIEIRILYLAEQTHAISVISQKQAVQKQMDIPQAEGVVPFVTVREDSTRCRVVNPRRIDVRGAVMLKVNLEAAQSIGYCARTENTPGRRNSLQERSASCTPLVGRSRVSEELSLSEESPLPYGNPPMGTVLLYRCCPVVEECRRSEDKALCKGKLMLHLLYLAKEDAQPHTAEFTVPVDAVLHLNVSPDAKLQPQIELIGAEFTPEEEKGETVSGQYQVRVSVTTTSGQNLQYVDDVYSTVCPVEKQVQDVPMLQWQEMLSQSGICKNVIAISGSRIARVFDMLCDVRGANMRQLEDGSCMLAVNLSLCLLAVDEEGIPFCVEKTVPCELQLNVASGTGEPYFIPQIDVLSVSCRITEAGEIEARTELSISGSFCRQTEVRMVSGVTADMENPFPQDEAGLRLYYARAGEGVWEIAKRFSTDYAMTLAENDLADAVLSEDRMLLIPVL